MYCKHCGNEVPADSRVCPSCGSVTEETGSTTTTTTFEEIFSSETTSPAVEAAKESFANKSLIFGILSIALAGIVGIIMAILGKKNVKEYEALNHGKSDGKAKIGSILSTIGIPVSIFAIIINVISFMVVFIGAMAENGLI